MTSASALPALSPNADQRTQNERSNRLIRQFNRLEQDVFEPMYAADTGTATAYAIQVSSDVKAYKVGQIFTFKAANANSGTAPTLNVNSLGAGTITLSNGNALVANDIAANGMTQVQVASTTPTFHLINPLLSPVPVTNSGATTFMVGNTAVGNGSFTNLCNTGSIGASGWVVLIMGQSVGSSTGGQTLFSIVISDGTNNIASAETVTPAAGQDSFVSCHAIVTLSGATTFTLKGEGNNATTSALASGAGTGMPGNKMTCISYVRLS